MKSPSGRQDPIAVLLTYTLNEPDLLTVNNGLKYSTLSLSLSLRLVEFIKKPFVVTRPVRDKHLGEGVALTICLDSKIACKSINVLKARQTRCMKG
jgi:type IV secretory pathway ATPase VirB11/archaellum biosynthesis ATPase